MTMRTLQFYQLLDSKKQRGVSVDVKNIYSLFQSSIGAISAHVSRMQLDFFVKKVTSLKIEKVEVVKKFLDIFYQAL